MDDDDPHREHLVAKADEHDEHARFHEKAAGGLRAELPSVERHPRGVGSEGKASEFSDLLKRVVTSQLSAARAPGIAFPDVGDRESRSNRSEDDRPRRVSLFRSAYVS